MKTKRTISNISYNTPDHFQGVVFDLVQRGVIEWCYWIQHKAEEDELKDHIHFVLQPSASLDTAKLGAEFREFDLTNPKPLGVTAKWNFTSGQDGMSNWILYCMHHPGYLASKGQVRTYHYGVEDFGTTDQDAFLEDVRAIDLMQFQRLQALADAVEQSKPFATLVQTGIIPIAQRTQYEAQYRALKVLKQQKRTGRKQSHEEPAGEIPGQMQLDLDIMQHIHPADDVEF